MEKKAKTDAERKAAQRARDAELVKAAGFMSLEGILSALRKGLIIITWIKK